MVINLLWQKIKNIAPPSPAGEGLREVEKAFFLSSRKDEPKRSPPRRCEPYQFGKYARQLRREMTKAEKVLWERLRARRFMDLKFRRQHPMLGIYADFYCHKKTDCGSRDGKYHEEDDATYYDSERTKELKRYGYSVSFFE